MKRFFKWLAILLGIGLLLIAIAVFTFPYWFGAALAAGGKAFGLSFAKYERVENGRFALSEIVQTNRNFDVRISRVEAYLPYAWYRSVQSTNRESEFLSINGWKVILHPKEAAPAAPKTNQAGIYPLWKKAERYIAIAREWVPKATFLNGTAVYGGRDYTFPVITWDQGKLDAGGVWPVAAVPYDIKGRLTGEQPYQISFNMSPLEILGRVQVTETNDLLSTKAMFIYKQSRIDLTANFGQEGMFPLTGTLRSADFKIPGDLVKLTQYNEFTGTLIGQWMTNEYALELTAHADPIAGAQLPPADIQIVASGDTNSVRVEQAKSTAPGLQLSISDPVELSYSGQLLSERSEMRISADLEKLPWLKLKGHFEGTLLLKKGEKFPIATIRAAGTKVEAYNVQAGQVKIAAVLNWPKLEEFKLDAELGTNGIVAIAGSADLEKRFLGESSIHIEGVVQTNLLPSQIQLSSVKLLANVSGSLTNLRHSGEFELRDLVTPQTEPLQLRGRWKAQQITFEELALRARAGPAVLRLRGRGFREDGRTNLVLSELALSEGEESYLTLTNPATISFLANGAVQLSPVRLTGEDRNLTISGEVKWPQRGAVEVEAVNIHPTLFQAFVKRSLKDLDLQRLGLSARWSNGPLGGRLAGNFSIAQPRFERITADVQLELDEAGLALSRLVLSNPTGEMASAQGFLPVSVNPVGDPRLKVSQRDQIDFELRTATNQAFWSTVSDLAKVRLTNPAVSLVVHGTTERPTGEFHARAEAIQLVRTNQDVPPIGPFEATIALNEQALRIRDFSVRVLGQAASISGDLLLGSNFWSQRREEILDYALTNANLRLEAPEIRIAPFAAYLPKYVSPQGELSADVTLKPGRNLDGRIEVKRVETRPLPKVGVVQSIRAAIELEGKEVKIEEFSGVLGGERMFVKGSIDLSPERVAQGYPEVDLAITGNNVPLARNPDVILRSDLDLRVKNGTNHVPVISGGVTLRDSFLLRDITTLVPGRVAGPSRRPPYFSVEQDPVDDWKLDIRVRGDHFMRVRSPFFQGVVSANFQVVGTLEEPTALGEASIASGTVVFPFATLEMRQALVSLTEEDPYLPHIFAIAGGRAFGFDIRMQAEGPANEPIIEFSSVPALSSEQIVLMLTTGQIPREDFSFSDRDRVGKLAVFLGKSLLTKLRPGKAGEEKLTVRSGEDITEQGRQTYEVEYKISPRWSLVGEYDRFGGLNANVKWRILSR